MKCVKLVEKEDNEGKGATDRNRQGRSMGMRCIGRANRKDQKRSGQSRIEREGGREGVKGR